MPGRAFADLFQLDRQLREIAGAHRVTIHGGDRLGGLGPLGGEILARVRPAARSRATTSTGRCCGIFARMRARACATVSG